MANRRSARRSRRRIRRPVSPGIAPGTLQVDPTAPKPVIRIMAYGPDAYEETELHEVAEIRRFLDRWPVTWVNVDGLGDAEILRALGEMFRLHPLALEDVVNVDQRPKAEEYEDNLFVVARMASLGESLETEQVALFLGRGFVLSFQERRGDCFDRLRERIRTGGPRLRRSGSDYLAYALLDSLIDAYFPVVEELGERLEAIEDEVIGDPSRDTLSRIQRIKHELLQARRATWPLRETVSSLLRERGTRFVTEDVRVFLRDCYDHAAQIMDLVESYRETGSGLMDAYMSTVSNRMNEVMKVLTIIATVFIPLGFIAGVYGMNFDPERSPWNMPELSWYWGYPLALGLMLVVAGGFLAYFWRKGWLD